MAKERLDKEAKEKAKLERERAKWKKQEAKRRNKKTPKVKVNPSGKLRKGISIAVAAILVLAIAAGIGYQMGMPQVVLPAAKVGDASVNAPEWAYYFYSTYMQMVSEAQQAAAYYQQMQQTLPVGTAVDTTVSAFGQPWKDPDTKKDIQLEDYLRKQTNERLKNLMALYQEAKKIKLKLSDEEQKKIDDAIAELKVSAGKQGVGASTYLTMNYVPGINLAKYRSIQEKGSLANAFSEKKVEEFRAKYTDAKLKAEYDKDPQQHLNVSLRVFTNFSTAKLQADGDESKEALAKRQAESDAKAKKDAEEFLAALTDEASFLTLADKYAKQAATPNYSADVATARYLADKEMLAGYKKGGATPIADWAYDTARKAGDKAVIQTDNGYLVVYLVIPAYQVSTVDYYSISVNFPTPAEGEELTAAQKTATKTEAEGIVKEWQKAGGTLGDFAALAQKRAEANKTEEDKAAEEDAQAEKKPAGLTEQAAPAEGTEGTALNQWLYRPERKERDHAVIETDAGYVFVVFDKQHMEGDRPDYIWMTKLTNEHVEKDYDAYLKELIKNYPLNENAFGMKFALKDAQKMCDGLVATLKAQSAAAG